MIPDGIKSAAFGQNLGLSRRAGDRKHVLRAIRSASELLIWPRIGLFRDEPPAPAASTFQIVKRRRICAYAAGRYHRELLALQSVTKEQHRMSAAVLNRRPDEPIRRWIVSPALEGKDSAEIVDVLMRRKYLGLVEVPSLQLWRKQRHQLQGSLELNDADHAIIKQLPWHSLVLVWDPPKDRFKSRSVKGCGRIRRRDAVAIFGMQMRESCRIAHAGIEAVPIEPLIMHTIETCVFQANMELVSNRGLGQVHSRAGFLYPATSSPATRAVSTTRSSPALTASAGVFPSSVSLGLTNQNARCHAVNDAGKAPRTGSISANG